MSMAPKSLNGTWVLYSLIHPIANAQEEWKQAVLGKQMHLEREE